MKFTFEPKNEDGGGDLIIEAEDTAEVRRVAEHFKVFVACDNAKCIEKLREEAAALEAGCLKITLHANDQEHLCTYETPPAWYRCVGKVDGERNHPYNRRRGQWGFLDPYLDCMRRNLGFQGALPELDLTGHCDRLRHTHLVDRLWIAEGVVQFDVFIKVGGYNKKTGNVYAQERATTCVANTIGGTRHEPEFVWCGNGAYKPNPNYMRQHAPEPCFGAPWLWDALFDWWRKTCASERQKQILDACDALHEPSKLEPDYRARYSGGCIANGPMTYGLNYSITFEDQQGTCGRHGDKSIMATVMKWEDFAKC